MKEAIDTKFVRKMYELKSLWKKNERVTMTKNVCYIKRVQRKANQKNIQEVARRNIIKSTNTLRSCLRRYTRGVSIPRTYFKKY